MKAVFRVITVIDLDQNRSATEFAFRQLPKSQAITFFLGNLILFKANAYANQYLYYIEKALIL